jgi:hypothetical protein
MAQGHRGGGRGGAVRVARPVHARPAPRTYARSYRPIYRPYYRYYRPYYGSAFYRSYYPYFWGSYGWWPYGYYSPYYWGAYGWGYPYYWGGYGYYRGYDPSASLGAARLQVTPRETEVYVDGYYAGVVDDFDGFAQRLRLEPGEHELTLFLDGHKPFTEKLRFTVGQTFRIKHEMEPLAAGEPAPKRPEPSAKPPAPPRRGYGYGRGPMGPGRPADRDPGAAAPQDDDRPEPPPPPRRPAPRDEPRPERGAIEATPGAGGQLSLRVQPDDAQILVDGEPWAGSSGDRLIVSLQGGVHRLEVRKDGFETYSGLVRVRPGAVTTLNVALTKEGARD